MTHHEYIKKNKPVMPCYAYHLTFGGKCLNCGYNPEAKESRMIYVVKYNGLFQHRDETWFPDKGSALEHVWKTAEALQDPSVCDKLTIEERQG